MQRALLMIGILSLALCQIGIAVTRNVPTDYPTIQAGINAAVNGDTVLVAPGTYVENLTLGVKNLTLGSLYLLDENINNISNTIIDGNSSGAVISIAGGQDSTTLICGFTIRRGLAQNGGGIYCDSSSSPIILDNHIIYNRATINGGGIYCFNSRGTVSNNHIANNAANLGGGGAFTLNSNLLFTNNQVYNNAVYDTGNGCGGGVVCYGWSSPQIVHNEIHNNTASAMGGGMFFCFCSPIIDSNVISNNSVLFDGAGIALNIADAIIRGNTFSNNTGINTLYSRGGGIFCGGSTAIIIDNIINNNSVSSSGGGIFCNDNRRVRVERNIIFKNYALNNGGGLSLSIGSYVVSKNTIIANFAMRGGGGIGYCCQSDSATIDNSIIRANMPDQIYQVNGDLIISYGDIQGGWLGTGNIDCDPLFCNPNQGDYSLAENSCCIGTGENSEDIGARGIGCNSPSCEYLSGDINSDGQRMGGDVIYGVRYLKGIGATPPDSCVNESVATTNHYLYVAADVNGDCLFRGSDITRLVTYFKGLIELQNCRFFPPPPASIPVLTTAIVSAITHTSAECGGTVISDGRANVTERGVCWSTNPSPSVADNKTFDGMGIGGFASSITGLAAGTPYFVKAYATNSAGTGYGNVMVFVTESPNTGIIYI